MSLRKLTERRGVKLGPTGWAGAALAAGVFAVGWTVCIERFGWWVGGLLGWWPSSIVAAAVGLAPIVVLRRLRAATSAVADDGPAASSDAVDDMAPAQRPESRQKRRIASDVPAD